MTKHLLPLMEHRDGKDLIGHLEELGTTVVDLGMSRYPRKRVFTSTLAKTHRDLCHSKAVQEG